MRRSIYLFTTAILMACGACAAAVSLKLSHYAFTGYDVSPMIDSGWRVFSGQVPGRDFIVTFPPSLYMTVALCFRMFGVSWHAIALGEAIRFAIILALGLRAGALIQAGWGTRFAVWLAASFAAGQALMLISINYPWHASMAQSFATYALMPAIALAASAKLTLPQRIEACLHLGLATSLLLLSKPNTAFPIVLFVFLILARYSIQWWLAVVTLAIATIAACSALAAVHTSFWQMLHGYAGVAGRILPRGLYVGLLPPIAHYGLVNLLVYAILAPALTLVPALYWYRRDSLPKDPLLLMSIVALLTAMVAMATNLDFKLTDTPLLLMGLTILVLITPRPEARTLTFRLVCTTLALLALSAYIGRSRYRMLWNIGSCRQVWIHDRFLGTTFACDDMQDELSDTDHVLAQHPGARIFMGPGLEFLYAGRGLPSPDRLPNWWDPGTSYSLKRTADVVTAWQQDRFDILLFNPDEMRSMMPHEIDAIISAQYVRTDSTASLHVYERRQPPVPYASIAPE